MKREKTFTTVGVLLWAGEDMLHDEGKKSFLEFGIRGVQQWSACRRIPHLKLVIMSYENITQTHEGLSEKQHKTDSAWSTDVIQSRQYNTKYHTRILINLIISFSKKSVSMYEVIFVFPLHYITNIKYVKCN